MVSSPEQLELNKLILKDPKLFYETIVRAVFRNAYVEFHKDVIWREFWDTISEENRAKVERVCHFYYYMCLPFKESYEIPDAKRLVFTASIMESLMTERHMDFIDFLMSRKEDNISEQKLQEFISQYKTEYGSSRKFRNYFENYFLEEDLRYLRHSIKKYKGGVLQELRTNKELADFLYNLRSQVVHNATLLTISNELIGAFDFDLRHEKYKLDIDMYAYLQSFEKSLVKYFTGR